jgi:adenosine deaminase
MMVRDFGCGIDDLESFTHNGLDGAWIDDTTRRQWRMQWSAEFAALRKQHQPDPITPGR